MKLKKKHKQILRIIGMIIGAAILANIIPAVCMTLGLIPWVEKAVGFQMLYLFGLFLNGVIGGIGLLFMFSFKLLRIFK